MLRFVKLHRLHVVKGSILAAQYLWNPFPLSGLEEYTDFLRAFLSRPWPDIVILRLPGVADRKLLIASNWNLSESGVQSHLDRELARRGVIQGGAPE